MKKSEEKMLNESLEDITGITCIYVPVKDVFTSVQWYRKNLGCEPTNHNAVEPGMTRAIMRFPDTNGALPDPGIRQIVPALLLMQVDKSAGTLGFTLDNGVRHPSFCFITPRIYEIADQLKENGVNILTDISEVKPGGPNLWFSDPDGNIMEVWQP